MLMPNTDIVELFMLNGRMDLPSQFAAIAPCPAEPNLIRNPAWRERARPIIQNNPAGVNKTRFLNVWPGRGRGAKDKGALYASFFDGLGPRGALPQPKKTADSPFYMRPPVEMGKSRPNWGQTDDQWSRYGVDVNVNRPGSVHDITRNGAFLCRPGEGQECAFGS